MQKMPSGRFHLIRIQQRQQRISATTITMLLIIWLNAWFSKFYCEQNFFKLLLKYSDTQQKGKKWASSMPSHVCFMLLREVFSGTSSKKHKQQAKGCLETDSNLQVRCRGDLKSVWSGNKRKKEKEKEKTGREEFWEENYTTREVGPGSSLTEPFFLSMFLNLNLKILDLEFIKNYRNFNALNSFNYFWTQYKLKIYLPSWYPLLKFHPTCFPLSYIRKAERSHCCCWWHVSQQQLTEITWLIFTPPLP